MATKKQAVGVERRRYPRINQNLRFDLFDETSEVQAESINLSRNGVYCKLDHSIPLMTNVKIKLTLPLSQFDRESKNIECNGVVVRNDESPDNAQSRIAIFFNDIGSYEQRQLDAYLAAHC